MLLIHVVTVVGASVYVSNNPRGLKCASRWVPGFCASAFACQFIQKLPSVCFQFYLWKDCRCSTFVKGDNDGLPHAAFRARVCSSLSVSPAGQCRCTVHLNEVSTEVLSTMMVKGLSCGCSLHAVRVPVISGTSWLSYNDFLILLIHSSAPKFAILTAQKKKMRFVVPVTVSPRGTTAKS